MIFTLERHNNWFTVYNYSFLEKYSVKPTNILICKIELNMFVDRSIRHDFGTLVSINCNLIQLETCCNQSLKAYFKLHLSHFEHILKAEDFRYLKTHYTTLQSTL